MTGFELDAVELGERVAHELDDHVDSSSCGCQWRKKISGRTRWAPCADHTPEPQDLPATVRVVWDGSPLLTVNDQPAAWYENWITVALQRSLDRRG